MFFFSLYVSFVVLALVFLPEMYPTAYRTAFLAKPADEDVFYALRVLGGCLLFVSFVFDFVCVFVSCVFIFIIVFFLFPFDCVPC